MRSTHASVTWMRWHTSWVAGPGGVNIARSDDDPYASMIDQHLWTPLNIVRALSPRMVAAGRGRIVAVSSPLAARPAAGMSAYAVGKAALEALVRTLSRELIGTGVTANLVRVRTIDTAHARDAGSTTVRHVAEQGRLDYAGGDLRRYPLPLQ